MLPSPPLTWFLIGVLFLIFEIAMPGFILIFFTAGSWVAALTVWLFNVQLTGQILIFLVSSLILLFVLRKYSLKIFRGGAVDNIEARLTDSKIGKRAVVTKKITSGMTGEIKIMGSFWRAVADVEIEEGKNVVVKGQATGDRFTFKVEPT